MKVVTLFGKAKTGKLLVWSIWTEGDTYIVQHGQLGGKLQVKSTTAKPKNVGRANATSAEQQALVEMEAKIVSQRKKGYYDTKMEALSHVEVTPMQLAKWDEHNHNIKYPCYVQTKIDGMKFMVDKNGCGISKSGESISLPEHIQQDVDFLRHEMGTSFKGLDGEIYAGNRHRGGLSLQKIISAFRKPNEDTPKLQYWIYNIPDSSDTFIGRVGKMGYIKDLIKAHNLNNVVVLDTTMQFDKDGVDGCFEKSKANKEEGIVVHNGTSFYEFGKRSYNSQKRKPRQDAEAKVIGSVMDKNGQGVLSCIAVNGEQAGAEFDCLMRKDSDEFINYREFENSLLLIGKHITYQYEDLTDTNTPSKPVGVGLRDVDESGNPIL